MHRRTHSRVWAMRSNRRCRLATHPRSAGRRPPIPRVGRANFRIHNARAWCRLRIHQHPIADTPAGAVPFPLTGLSRAALRVRTEPRFPRYRNRATQHDRTEQALRVLVVLAPDETGNLGGLTRSFPMRSKLLISTATALVLGVGLAA